MKMIPWDKNMNDIATNERISGLEQKIEYLADRIRVIDNEKLALEVILLATAATASEYKVELIKNYIESMASALENSGVNENPEYIAARRAVYKRVFSRTIGYD